MPRVTVLIPLYNGRAYIEQSLQSVLAQTFADWEVIVVNEYGSNDGGAEIVLSYGQKDPRFKMIQNEKRLGLAESLNVGIRAAEGEYIARLDADDTALPERFEKQIAFMDAHPDVGLCGTWQKHYGNGNEWVHTAEPNPDKLRCMLLFWCDLCHSTLMLRKSAFLEHGLFYDPKALAEDFELWSRAMQFMQIANLPEVLGTYNESTGITPGKKELLNKESGIIASRTLDRILGIKLEENETCLLNSWINPIKGSKHRDDDLCLLRDILTEVWIKNQHVGFFDSDYLLQILAAKWYWTKDYLDWKTDYSHIHSLSQVFSDEYRPGLLSRYTVFRAQNPSIKGRTKKITKKLLRPLASASRRVTRALMKDVYQQIDTSIERWTWDRYDRLNHDIEAWTWDRYDRLNHDIEAWTWDRYDRLNRDIEAWTWERYKRLQIDLEKIIPDSQKHFLPHKAGTSIRIGILFQIPSAWASLESVWFALQNDSRFEPILYLYDETQTEKAQMAGARSFLEEKKIPYKVIEQYTLVKDKPQILFYQTPWDDRHRPRWLQSDVTAQLGIRIAYIPYGLNYSASVWKDYIFSDLKLKSYPWKIFTFSERMRFDHICMSPHGGDNVVAVGHPKFDAFVHRDEYPLPNEVIERIAGRKVVFFQIHFPGPDGNPSIPEANIQVYIDFFSHAERYTDLFFIVRPHPKTVEYYETHDMHELAEALVSSLSEKKNVWWDHASDYRAALFAADYIVGDRSALLVEAGALGVPVLYMTNYYYKEKILPAVEPLFTSYYQGSFAYDIELFLDMVVKREIDYKKQEREIAARECLPPADGLNGQRIVEYIIDTLDAEESVKHG